MYRSVTLGKFYAMFFIVVNLNVVNLKIKFLGFFSWGNKD